MALMKSLGELELMLMITSICCLDKTVEKE